MMMFQAWCSRFSLLVGLPVSAHTGDLLSLLSGLTASLLISVHPTSQFLALRARVVCTQCILHKRRLTWGSRFYIAHSTHERTDLGSCFFFLASYLKPCNLISCVQVVHRGLASCQDWELWDCMGFARILANSGSLHTPLAISFEEWWGRHPGWLPSGDDFASDPWWDEHLLWLVFRWAWYSCHHHWEQLTLASDFSLFPREGRNGP